MHWEGPKRSVRYRRNKWLSNFSLTGISSASAYYPPNGVCSDFYVPLSIDYEGPEWNASRWNNAFELQDFLSTATASGRAEYPAPLGAMKRFRGTYEIAATFCTPRTPKDGKEKTVIVATHGIGPAREHWNSPYRPDEFNFVKHSLDKGYSVFFYDRLGCGASSRYMNHPTLSDGILLLLPQQYMVPITLTNHS